MIPRTPSCWSSCCNRASGTLRDTDWLRLSGYPVSATDYELVDLFNWQEEAAGMLSQMEFVRRVDVQSETVEHYIQEGKIQPDLVVPMSEHRSFKYFKEETLVASGRTVWVDIDQ